MELKKIQDKKDKAEKDILKILEALESETKCSVTECRVTKVDPNSFGLLFYPTSVVGVDINMRIN